MCFVCIWFVTHLHLHFFFFCKNHWKTQVFAAFSCVPLHPFGSCGKVGRLLLSTVRWFWHIFWDFLYPSKKSWKPNSFARFFKTLQKPPVFTTFWRGTFRMYVFFKSSGFVSTECEFLKFRSPSTSKEGARPRFKSLQKPLFFNGFCNKMKNWMCQTKTHFLRFPLALQKVMKNQ